MNKISKAHTGLVKVKPAADSVREPDELQGNFVKVEEGHEGKAVTTADGRPGLNLRTHYLSLSQDKNRHFHYAPDLCTPNV